MATVEPTQDWDAVIFRSSVDHRVWMCNIPETDIATGVQSSTSLKKLKTYVEDVMRPDIFPGSWTKTAEDYWEYHGEDSW